MVTDKNVTVQFTKDEMIGIINALNEVLHGPQAIEEWEFSMRMCLERSEAERLLDKLNELYDSVFPKHPS